MKLKNPLLVVTDMDKSVEFYKNVLGLHIIMDFDCKHRPPVSVTFAPKSIIL